jgi:acyl-CoA thioester hydrolase
MIHVGLRVAHLGNSSVKYEVAIFKNDDYIASAMGHFVHVYVDRKTNKPTPIPQNVRDVLQQLVKAD